MLPFDLGHVAKQLEWRALQCMSGLVHTGKSDNDTDLDWALPIVAQATSDQLESSVHLLWLAQETSETMRWQSAGSPCFKRHIRMSVMQNQ